MAMVFKNPVHIVALMQTTITTVAQPPPLQSPLHVFTPSVRWVCGGRRPPPPPPSRGRLHWSCDCRRPAAPEAGTGSRQCPAPAAGARSAAAVRPPGGKEGVMGSQTVGVMGSQTVGVLGRCSVHVLFKMPYRGWWWGAPLECCWVGLLLLVLLLLLSSRIVHGTYVGVGFETMWSAQNSH